MEISEQLNDEITLKAEVEDEGIGIPPDKLEMIFEPFNQVGDRFSGKYGGTGLGLSITRSLVEMMGGTIGVESQPGNGSKFYFTVRLKLPA
jgi:signal transduction histidine kinase